MSERKTRAYWWAWDKWPAKADAWAPGERKGQRCRLLAVGRRNAVAVEFEDGTRCVTLRYGLRRKKPKERKDGKKAKKCNRKEHKERKENEVTP